MGLHLRLVLVVLLVNPCQTFKLGPRLTTDLHGFVLNCHCVLGLNNDELASTSFKFELVQGRCKSRSSLQVGGKNEEHVECKFKTSLTCRDLHPRLRCLRWFPPLHFSVPCTL